MSDRRIGVYICHCGGNISDYVDVEKVRQAVQSEPGVVVAKTAMFTCSDATQQEMVQDIQEQQLDGLVVASCSPKLHLFTFREVAKRAGLNPYQYTQVNVREQCSWTHTDDYAGATAKAIRLVRGGIARTRLTEPLQPIKIDTVPKVLVVGAGIAGMRAAVGLSDLGLAVLLIEREPVVGGWVAGLGNMYPHGKNGRKLIAQLTEEIKQRKNITLFTGAELVGKSGSIGNFNVKIRVGGKGGQSQEDITTQVGSIIVAAGFDNYQPAAGEYGYGIDGVLTLAEYKELLDGAAGKLSYHGREIKDMVYVYCVGSRQQSGEHPNRYCSRYCCNAAVHASIESAGKNPGLHQYHLFRDMRTYGKFELLYSQAREKGAVFLRFDHQEPPTVEKGAHGKLTVKVKDLLTYGEQIEIPADVVVLVTGMVPRSNANLVDVLKLPLGQDKFFNEIHPKLRPVETVVDGVFICGTCQGPKNSSESVASALSAVTQSASILKKGFVELEPLIAAVNPDVCQWCDGCADACPYSAIEQVQYQGRAVAKVNEAVCKGCGGCAPLCPNGAINLKGYTDEQMKSMIDAFLT
ncbi:CoB--CoM heterodisulfide reductase iron-sulfur subunit A family protein [Desulfoscipio gibsoniae]|uniref:FAD binding protein n=1 Tax=Desulfoscipio gibsoniae DSM 7213 TaxID=767817 RepID=R4KII0_9FIRM|nr:CoB--CoM heterodisulfide reductase iron-sulfur subunit A family protein [Desulfoscipio gibsoniae]AGL00345.1 FAD binding protein [Desulfoscipio gibsoniae DSM 7213]